MATDPLDIYGTDLDWGADLNPTGRMIKGVELLGQAAYHRLNTPRGGCQDAPDDGLDLAEYLHEEMTPARLAAVPAEIRSELLKDDRFEEAEVVLSQTGTYEFKLSIRITTSAGPQFDLVLGVADAAVKLLSVKAVAS